MSDIKSKSCNLTVFFGSDKYLQTWISASMRSLELQSILAKMQQYLQKYKYVLELFQYSRHRCKYFLSKPILAALQVFLFFDFPNGVLLTPNTCKITSMHGRLVRLVLLQVLYAITFYRRKNDVFECAHHGEWPNCFRQ